MTAKDAMSKIATAKTTIRLIRIDSVLFMVFSNRNISVAKIGKKCETDRTKNHKYC